MARARRRLGPTWPPIRLAGLLSKSQIERLGIRLVAEERVRPEDLAALHELLAAYGQVLDATLERVRSSLGVAPTARVKNTGTILEKLHRFGGSWLKSLDDLAGMRIVGDFDRNGQDELVARIVELFGEEQRPPKVIDRRAEPVQGYRAVHVVVYPGGTPVEIQVRTGLQHEWAELFEKLADNLGRGIRYGEPPQGVLSSRLQGDVLSRVVRDMEAMMFKETLGVAATIDRIEQAEQLAPEAIDVAVSRRMVRLTLARLRKAVASYEKAAARP